MSTSPAADGYVMPAEWEPHTRTWMSWPAADYMTVGDPDNSFRAWSQVANTIVNYEPLTMLVDPSQLESASAWLDPRIEVVAHPLDDCWLRDNGPSFLLDRGGRLAGADWTFNAWGNGWASYDRDDTAAAAILERASARRYRSEMVNEGGGIHVDGRGTVLITETVQRHESRNPGWTKHAVEAELGGYLGVTNVIWFPRGLTADYGRAGTNGHVDLLAAFVKPGVVLCHVQPDAAHPDFEITHDNLAILRASTDAAGRALEVIELLAPTVTEVDGKLTDYSYINHYLANGLSLLCSFDDPRDKDAADTFARLFPQRAVEFVDARPIFNHGGGIHCITQQQPAPTNRG